MMEAAGSSGIGGGGQNRFVTVRTLESDLLLELVELGRHGSGGGAGDTDEVVTTGLTGDTECFAGFGGVETPSRLLADRLLSTELEDSL